VLKKEHMHVDAQTVAIAPMAAEELPPRQTERNGASSMRFLHPQEPQSTTRLNVNFGRTLGGYKIAELIPPDHPKPALFATVCAEFSKKIFQAQEQILQTALGVTPEELLVLRDPSSELARKIEKLFCDLCVTWQLKTLGTLPTFEVEIILLIQKGSNEPRQAEPSDFLHWRLRPL